MLKFPSIDQFRHAVHAVKKRATYTGTDTEGNPTYDHSVILPTLTFKGTVKLHGTNAGIVLRNGVVTYQSREQELALTRDNAGFMNAMQSQPVDELFRRVVECYAHSENPTIAIYGEWCGQGIQKKVAIAELSKRFVIFAIKVDDNWLRFENADLNIPGSVFYSVHSFPTWTMDINFERPEEAQNAMVEITEAVEAQCPVAMAFDVDGIGEGVVWWCIEDGYRDIQFKVKGDKHSVSRVDKLASVDVEKVKTVHDFCDRTVTEARLEQGLGVLLNELRLPLEMTSMGAFIKWVHSDIVKEETDTMTANGLDQKSIGSGVANAARKWFVAQVNTRQAA